MCQALAQLLGIQRGPLTDKRPFSYGAHIFSERQSGAAPPPLASSWREPLAVGTRRPLMGWGVGSWALTAADAQKPTNDATLPSGSFG